MCDQGVILIFGSGARCHSRARQGHWLSLDFLVTSHSSISQPSAAGIAILILLGTLCVRRTVPRGHLDVVSVVKPSSHQAKLCSVFENAVIFACD